MSIHTTCPECDTSYRVKDSLRGKRIRCRKCQSPVLVAGDLDDLDLAPDIASLETNPDIDALGETQDELPLRRWRFGEREVVPAVPLNQRLLAQTARSPWVGLGLIFCGFWTPFSILEPKFVIVMNVIGLSLCALGSITGLVLERLCITFPNPLDILNQATIGGLAARGVSAEHSIPAVTTPDSDGRRLAKQFAIILAFLLVHAAVLLLLRQQQVLP